MERSEQIWVGARHQARSYLRRFTDPWTCSHRDDLVQEAALAVWRWRDESRDPRCAYTAARTIARRARIRALDELQRELQVREELAHARDGRAFVACYRIAGRRVPLTRLLPWVRRALARLAPDDRRLLLDFHAGFCCAELSARSGRSEAAVKTRIHRARRRLRSEIEACVRGADELDSLTDHEEGDAR